LKEKLYVSKIFCQGKETKGDGDGVVDGVV
jgi:hypothetical protein